MNNKLQKTADDSVSKEKIIKYLEAMNMTQKLNKSEVEQFIEISQAFQLNPFKREIYANKYGDKMSIIVGFETYIKRAERSGELSGWAVETKGSINHADIQKSDVMAIITIHRKDWDHPFVHSVHFSEYFQNTMIWKTKPITMIKKVAMAQGFRLCFSDELGGMPYTGDEIQTEQIPTDATVVDVVIDEPVKKSPGRPKKTHVLTPPEFPTHPSGLSNPHVLDAIKEATTIQGLMMIYDSCIDCRTNPTFMAALTERKIEIRVAEINAIDDEDKLWEMATNEKEPKILIAINDKLQTFTNSTENTENANELF